jgi:catechol 2,3-dioxygenase-like lactoylglutathione lyase family enzyme
MQQTVIPQLRITDVAASLAFYVDGLGFKVDWQHQFEPGFPLFMQITRNGQTLFLTQHSGDCAVGAAVYFVVPDAQAFYAECVGHGTQATQQPTPTPWGTCECVLTDPDGNRLRFASELAPCATHHHALSL